MKLILALLLTVLFTSCATKVVIIKTEGLVPLKDFAKVTYVSGNDFDFKMGTFSDERQIKDSIGIAHTGARDEKTPIQSDIPLTDYVSSRLNSLMEKRGFIIKDESQYTLSGEIKEFWISETAGAIFDERSHCNVKLAIALKTEKKGAVNWLGEFSVKATSKSTIGDTTTLDGNMMESCMNLIVEKIIRDPRLQNLARIRLINK